MNDLKYFVVDSKDIDKVDWSNVVESSGNHCRWNKDRTKFIVKSSKFQRWYLNKPIYNLFTIKQVISSNEW